MDRTVGVAGCERVRQWRCEKSGRMGFIPVPRQLGSHLRTSIASLMVKFSDGYRRAGSSLGIPSPRRVKSSEWNKRPNQARD